VCVDGTDGTSFTPFCTATSGVEDEITLEELKWENDRRRYLQMADLAKQEKILKSNEYWKQKNIPNQGTVPYNHV
jgi:hypothetical protein